MVPDTREWRRTALYDFMDDADADDLAWECLRRNKSYQNDFARSLDSDAKGRKPDEVIESKWGLRFPCSSQPLRLRPGHLLDAGNRQRRHPYRPFA